MAEYYSDSQKENYIQLAKEVGIHRAKKALGYPKSDTTGTNWCRDAGVETPKSVVSVWANKVKSQVSMSEQRLVGSMMLDRIHVLLADARAVDIKNLSEAYARVIASIKDIDARSDGRAEESMAELKDDPKYQEAMRALEQNNSSYEA